MAYAHKGKVVERALVARVNRQLGKKGEALRKCRSDSRWHNDLGSFYLVGGGMILAQHIDLAALAREMKVMEPWEVLAED